MKLLQTLLAPTALIAVAIAASCSGSDKSAAISTKEEGEAFDITEFDTIYLDAPDLTREGSLMTALQQRKSTREFSHEALSRQQVADMLWAAGGLNRNDSVHTTAPSARALYPIEIYATFDEGIFRYDKVLHALVPVAEGNYMELTGRQPFVKDASVNLLYIANYASGSDERWAMLDAGHNSQNVNLYCASEGLGVVVRGMVERDSLMQVMGLDPEQYSIIMAQSVGK
jgi:nitroreductase